MRDETFCASMTPPRLPASPAVLRHYAQHFDRYGAAADSGMSDYMRKAADDLETLRAELTEARRQLKEADSQKCIASIVPDGTTHIRKIGRRSFAGGEYALYFECFKNDGAQWLYYHTDNDNEYPCWCNLLDGRYRNPDEVISSLVSIIVPVQQPAVPDAVAKDSDWKHVPVGRVIGDPVWAGQLWSTQIRGTKKLRHGDLVFIHPAAILSATDSEVKNGLR